MILFLDDWKKYPGAKLHLSTKNTSFIRLARVYRAMGVDNHGFILALHNPQLEFVDPHDPNLTQEQITMIIEECFNNPWYVIREVIKVPGAAGEEPIPVEANRGLICLWWCFFNHIMLTLIMPRQTGKSFAIDSLDACLMNIWLSNAKINLMTKDDKLRRENIQRIKDSMETLPWYLHLKDRSDTNNGEEITINARGNVYKSHVARAAEKDAYNLGRGMSSPIFRIDEGPFQSNIRYALGAALSAGLAHIEKAQRADAPWGTTFTTTAGKLNDPDGLYFYETIYSMGAPMTEKFYDCKNVEELEKIVRANSKNKHEFMITAVYSHRQLGKTDQWMLDRLEKNKQTGDDANRDMFNVWTAGSLTNPLPTSLLEIMAKHQKDADYNEIGKNGFILRWYIPESQIEQRLRSSQFIMGSDTSEGSGRDDITVYILDIETLETVCEGTFNELNIILISQFMADILIRFSTVTAIIEHRSTGITIIDQICITLQSHGIDPFKRLFNWIVQDADSREEQFRLINQPPHRIDTRLATKFKRDFGYATSGSGVQSRDNLYGLLHRAADSSATVMYSRILVEQISCLTMKNGRIDHKSGGHDDLVIAWLLCHWLLYNGKNLNYYGIDSKRIMSRIKRPEVKQLTVREQADRFKQARIREEITEIHDLLSNTNDEYIIERLENKLRVLDKQLVLEDGEVYSIDALLRSVNEARKRRKIMSSNRR